MWLSKISNREMVDPIALLHDGNALGTGYVERDWDQDPFCNGYGATEFNIPIIQRSDWAEMIEKIEKTDSLLSTKMDRIKVPILDQGSTSYCWINGVVDGIHATRAKAGLPFVYFSPASAGAKIKNYQNRGGWGSEAIEGINEYGICHTDLWPANGISKKYDTDASRRTREKNSIPEYWELPPKKFAAVMTALIHGFPVPSGLLWWRHLVDFVDPVVLGRDEFGVRFRNSWGDRWGDNGYGILTERKATPDEAVVPRTFTLSEAA
jgi:hypothetical protein